MQDPMLSAAREVLRCKHCGRLIMVLTLESPNSQMICSQLLDALMETFKMRSLMECHWCAVSRTLDDLPSVP